MSDFSFPLQLFKIWHFLVVIPFCRLLAMVDCGGCFFTTVMAYLWTIAAPWRFMADMVAYNGELLAFHHGHHVQSITQSYTNFSFVSIPSFYWMCLLKYIYSTDPFISLPVLRMV
jgi:hypothetical protein